jgi:innexin
VTNSFIIWFIRSVCPIDRLRFVHTHVGQRLDEHYVDSSSKRDAVHKFTRSYLQSDGVMLLRLIAHNTDGITTTEIASALFDQWIEYEASSSKALEASSESVSLTSKKERSGSTD